MKPHGKPRLQAREQILIIAALMVSLVAAYGLLRIKPQEEELDLFHAEMRRLQSAATQNPGERGAHHRLDDVRAELAQSEQALEHLRQKLADHTRHLVDSRSSEAVESLMLAITEIASLAGVNIRQAENYAGALAGTPGSTKGSSKTASPLAERPVRKLLMTGTYAQALAFIAGINSMPTTIKVLSFNLQVADSPRLDAHAPELNIEMVLLL